MTLLAEAPTGRHFAQFHGDAGALGESVHAFLEAGLRREQSVLVIANAAEHDGMLKRLNAAKFHTTSLCNAGQLAIIDAAATLEHCMSQGEPVWTRFRAALMPVLSRIQPNGRGTRIYSALTGLLWHDGKTDAAIRLEELWNALAVSVQFSLYCGYQMNPHVEESYAGPLEEVGRTHSDILGTPEDEQFGMALDRASKEIFGISLTQMAGASRQDGARRFPSGQRAMLWVKRNLPMSSAQLAERARQYYQGGQPRA